MILNLTSFFGHSVGNKQVISFPLSRPTILWFTLQSGRWQRLALGWLAAIKHSRKRIRGNWLIVNGERVFFFASVCSHQQELNGNSPYLFSKCMLLIVLWTIHPCICFIFSKFFPCHFWSKCLILRWNDVYQISPFYRLWWCISSINNMNLATFFIFN